MKALILALSLLNSIFILACSSSSDDVEHRAVKWVLSRPVSFDLRIPPQIFKGQLPSDPELAECHTQGMEIVNENVIISCSLYNSRQKIRRSYAAESLLLKAPLKDITNTAQKHHIAWSMKKITETVPAAEQKRITDSMIRNIPSTLGTFMNWFLPLDDIEHVMGHPSGLAYDQKAGGLWVANAVYGWDSYTHLLLLDPDTLEPIPKHQPLAVHDHLGFVATTAGPFLWSFNWGKEPRMIIIDPSTGKTRWRPRPVPNNIAYQDCDNLDEHTILCAGGMKLPNSWYPQRDGVLHMLSVSGNELDYLKVYHTETLVWRPKFAEKVSSKFGSRSFVSVETIGDIEMDESNYYGDYTTPLPLTNAGMAVGPNKKYIYFLPDDLPHARLIRFELSKVPAGKD